MSSKKNIRDKAFRESLRQHKQTPPEGIWMGIRERLENDRRKNRMAWIGRIAASAALVIAAGSIWVIIQRAPDRVLSRQESIEPVSEQQESIEPVSEQQESQQPVSERKESGQPVSERRDPLQVTGDQKETTADLPGKPSEGFDAAELSVIRGTEPAFTGVVAQDRTEAYTIPVNAPEPELILAERRQAALPGPGEQGIDVFEEFGDKGYTDYDRWAVGGQVAPIYSYRNLDPSLADAMYANSYLNDIESGIVSYAGGVNLNYSPAKRLSIQSGLNYFRMGMSVRDTYIAAAGEKYFGMDFSATALAMSNSSGDIQLGGQKANAVLSNARSDAETSSIISWGDAAVGVADVRQGDLQQNFEYIEVPVILRYRLVDRRAGVNLLGGLSTNFLVGSNVYFRENGSREHIGTTENLKPVNYSSVLGLGFQYSINPNLHFNMEPTFRYYLNSINPGSGPGSHPYSIGFFTGISYSF